MPIIQPLDAFHYIRMTTKLGLPYGDVISIDSSNMGTKVRGVPAQEQGASIDQDDYLLGIATSGTPNEKGILVADNEKSSWVGFVNSGCVHVRQADDGVAVQTGEVVLAETDTQTVKDGRGEDVTSIKCGVVDGTEAYSDLFTTLSATFDDEEFQTFMGEWDRIVGMVYPEDLVAGGDTYDLRVKVILSLQPKIVLADSG